MTAPSNANTSGLTPCPFCGGEAWLNDYEAKYSDLPPMSRSPQCRSCGASLGYLTTPAKATEAWNRRVTAASSQARIAELEALVSKCCDLSVEQTDKLLAMHDRATAAEARADRLTKAGDRLVYALHRYGFPVSGGARVALTDRGSNEAVELDEAASSFRAALQQEMQP